MSSSTSFHVLLATIGRDSIFHMLDCVKEQLNPNDYLTIVFDGPDLPNVDGVKEKMSEFQCKTNVIVEETRLGFYGHAIRNKHNRLTGDFVFHIDDDDTIPHDCMSNLRTFCLDKNILYIFKMDHFGSTIWKTKDIIEGQIGTPMGIVPTRLNHTSQWLYRYGGDHDFYKKIEADGNPVEFVDKVIYRVFKRNSF